MMKMATITTTDLAAELETTPRTLRKFLRADAKVKGTETPGKGSRYAIEKREVRALAKRFADWTAAQAKTDDDTPAEGDDA
jgi:predicted transcriptional regulator